ncbi:unnamed protein product, partial [Symbiodinium sp. KB8]
HLGRRNLSVGGRVYDVPGYAVMANTWASHHVQNWYGREVPGKGAVISQSVASKDHWQQRWTSFKWLLLQKPSVSGMEGPKPRIIAFPSWHLDSAEADSCWSFDPSAVPLADWIMKQMEAHKEEDPREALHRLSDEVNDELGPKYASEYEEAQLAVRLVDWLVATEGCNNFKPVQAGRLLSTGLWLTLRSRLLRAWQDIWGADSVERVALAVLRRLAEPEELEVATPAECAGLQTFLALCEGEGDGSAARVRLYPEGM